MLLMLLVVHNFIPDPMGIYLTFGTCIMLVLTMAESNRTLCIRRSVIIMSVVFNIIYLPEMFRLFDRPICVVPVYFLFGLMYSVILLDSKTATVLVSIETLYYAVFLYFFRNPLPDFGGFTQKEINFSFISAIIAVLIVGFCGGGAVRSHFISLQRAQEEAEKLKSEAMDAYVAKDMFLINMSHEIRTPMNAIVGTVDLLLDRDVSEHVSDSVYNILNSCNALLSITDELMDLSKSENGEIELYTSTYDLSDLLMEVVNMMTVRLTESNLDFYVEINKNIPRFLYGDAAKLRQLFVNILNNSVKFTESGSITLRVDYQLDGKDTIELIADIEDTGIGIRKEDIPDLFVRHEDNEDDVILDGSGMGLAICADIVNEMNGSISVKSEYLSGSVFTIRVPQKFTSLDTIAYVPDPDRFKVLIFEKDRKYSDFVKKILDSFDIAADTASTKQDIERLMNINRYSHVFVSNERYDECEPILNNRLVSENIVAFLDIDDNVHVSKATTVLTRPIHALNIASLLRNETNNYVREVSRKGGFECPKAVILVVDDNHTNLKVAEAILTKYGANVLTAMSGKDGLRILKDNDVDLVFLDYMMPEMNGIDTLENIRMMPGTQFSTLPVIALTANVVSGAREMFLDAGFDDFLAKPISIDRMERILRKYLRRDLIINKISDDGFSK